MKNILKTGLVGVAAVAVSLVGFSQAFGYGGGGGSRVSFVQTLNAPVGGFSIAINNSAVQTGANTVTLSLNGGADAVRMAISNNADFTGASQETYAATKAWTLGSGNGLKTVYVKFFDKNGNASPVVTAAIVDTSVGTQSVTGPQGQVLGVKVAAIDELIAATKLGMRSNKVAELQTELRTRGFFPASQAITSYYGPVTRAAVAKYVAGSQTTQVLGVKVASIDELIAATKFGTRGDKVAALQTELRARGFFPTNIGSTGFYGSITKAAIAKYQASI